MKLRDAEHMQLVTEMRRHIAELQLQVVSQSMTPSHSQSVTT